ncbi:MAG: efflux RND transporter periplasmic adaptor subunit [Ignavibacteriaceae bacterium]|jgi:HlyD family secretion protein
MKLLQVTALFALMLLFGCGNNSEKSKIEASGFIQATNVTVSAKVGGEIKQILKDEGTFVNENDTILIIDTESLHLQLQQAEASLLQAQAQFDLLKNGSRKEDLLQAEALQNQAEINLASAKQDRERFQQLLNSKSVSQKQFDDIEARYDLATQQANAAKENYKKMKNIARKEDLMLAQGRVLQAQAQVGLVKKSIRDAYVVSPVKGFITKKFIEKGETVNPLSSLFTVSDLHKVELLIYINETEIGKIKLADKVTVTSDSYKDKKYYGMVTFISPEAEFTPKNIQTKDERTKLVYQVKVTIPNESLELNDGMPADAEVIL